MQSAFNNPIITLLLGALVPLIIGSLYAVAKRFVRRRVSIHSPEAEVLHRIETTLVKIESNQVTAAETIKKIDTILGLVVPAFKVTVKKIRCDLGKLEKGEIFNGDLDEAWDGARKAEEIYQGMRTIETGC